MSTSTLECPHTPPERVATRPVSSWPVVTALLVVLTAVLAGTVYLMPTPPAEDSVEVGFARDMSAHHGQAIAMAEALRDRTNDPTLRALAADVALTQQAEIGMMYAWLEEWGRTVGTSGPRMAWMGTPTLERMPGMADPAAEAALSTLPVAQAEAAFLRLMVAHHSGGVAMAQAGADLAEEPRVIRLAENIARSQTAEIEYLQSLLRARGLPPADVVQAAPHEVADSHDDDSPDGRDTVLLSLMAAGVAAVAWLVVDGAVRRTGHEPARPRAVALVLAAAALVTSAVHLVLTPQHAGESAVYGVFFSGTAVLAAAGAAAALVAPRAAARAAAGVGAVLIGLYVLFRFVPPPGAAAPESVDVWGVVAVAAEVITLTSAVALLRTARRDRRGLPVA